MISTSPVSKMVPMLLLTLAVFAPVGFAAPAHINRTALLALANVAPRDSDASEPPPSTVTAFFTPAVFLQNYYSPTVAADVPEPTQHLSNDVASDNIETDGTMDSDTGVASVASDVAPTPAQNHAVETPVADLDPSSTSLSTTGNTAPPTSSIVPSDSTAGEATTSSASSSTVVSGPRTTPTHQVAPTTTLPLASPTETSAAKSQHTSQSRKAAVIGVLLALGSILLLVLFAFCMRVPRVLRGFKKNADELIEPFEDPDMEKVVNSPVVEQNSSTARQHVSADLNTTLPVLSASAPSPLANTQKTEGGKSESQHAQYQQLWYCSSVKEDQFEDVTHVLTDSSTFAVNDSDCASNRTSTSSSQASERDRQSRGAASVAQSYATCDSRYSTPSVQDGSSESVTDGQSASFHSAPSRSPSPTDSPMPDTPKHRQSVTRPRSKTLNEDQMMSLGRKNSMPSSKSFPARFSNRLSEHSAMWSVLEEESEWDIAAHYGARYSARHSAGPELGIMSEHMETVDIGGRNCILVQG